MLTTDEGVANTEGPIEDEDCGDWPLTNIELGLDHHTRRTPIRVRGQLHHLGLEEDLLHQVIHPLTSLGTDLGREDVTTELLDHHIMLEELLPDSHRVRGREIHLVDRNDDRDTSILRMADSPDRPGHHRAIGGHNEDDDNSRWSTPGLPARRCPVGRPTLSIATTIGTPAFFAWQIASPVWGITESAAATTRTTISVASAPRARIAVKAA